MMAGGQGAEMNPRGQDESGFRGSDEPTPPTGIPLGEWDSEITSPLSMDGRVVSAEDFGKPSPSVIGGQEPLREQSSGDAGDWPTLEYRSKNKPERGSGALDWLRRKRDQ